MKVLILVSMLAAASAFAGDDKGDKPGAPEKPGIPAGSRAITWDELRARCEHPEQFDVQRAPQNIRIQCSDSQKEFVAASSGEIPLPSARHVMTAVFADKFHVASEERPIAAIAKAGSCLRFKEIVKTLTIERPVSCVELLGQKGDAGDFCTAALDQGKGSYPKLVEVADTGTVLDTCATSAGGGKDK